MPNCGKVCPTVANYANGAGAAPYLCTRKPSNLKPTTSTPNTHMKKIFTDHVTLWFIIALVIAAAALVLAIGNRKQLRRHEQTLPMLQKPQEPAAEPAADSTTPTV